MRVMWCGLVWLFHVAVVQAAQPITLFCYQHKPPYVIDYTHQKGLYFDLAERLEELLPAYDFSIRDIPRRRLDRQLADGKLQGLVLGVSSGWFKNSGNYSFTEPFIEDANMLVSRSNGEASRLTLASLGGHRLGLVAGHHYPELEQALQGGTVSRQDSVNERVNLERLQRGWIDATVVGRRTLEFFWLERPSLSEQVFVAQPPLNRYTRHLLVPSAYSALLPDLNRAIKSLGEDQAWQAKLETYR